MELQDAYSSISAGIAWRYQAGRAYLFAHFASGPHLIVGLNRLRALFAQGVWVFANSIDVVLYILQYCQVSLDKAYPERVTGCRDRTRGYTNLERSDAYPNLALCAGRNGQPDYKAISRVACWF